MANTFIPFNFQPVAVSVKTASYLIPAGRYARVTVEVDSGGVFTINGTSAVTSAAFVNIDTVNAGGTASYTVPTGFKASIASVGSADSATSSTINGNANNPFFGPSDIGPGGSVTAVGTNNPAFASQISGVATPSNATNRQATLWLPSGTTIAGTGNWRAVVEEYLNVS